MLLGIAFSLFLLAASCVAKPVKPDGQVNVTLSISVSTANFDEDTRTLSGIIWMNLAWKDERLASAEPMRHVAPGDIWIPDITSYHSPFHAEDNDALVFSGGTVVWVPKVTYSVTCVESSVRFFPRDSYVCRLVLGSWTHGKSELALTLGDDGDDMLGPLQESSVWAMNVKNIELYYKKYPKFDEIYPKGLFDIELKRKDSSLGIILIFPAIMTALMTVAMFILPSECREKVTFGALIFLSLILIMKDLQYILPAGGVTAIACYYAVNLAFVSVTLFFHCCLVLMSYPANSAVRPHRCVRKFASCFSAVSCFASDQLELDDTDVDDPDMSNSAKGARNIAEWRFVARMVDRLLLLLFTFLLILIGVLTTIMADEDSVKYKV